MGIYDCSAAKSECSRLRRARWENSAREMSHQRYLHAQLLKKPPQKLRRRFIRRH